MYQAINKFFNLAASTVAIALSLSIFHTSKAAAVNFNHLYACVRLVQSVMF